MNPFDLAEAFEFYEQIASECESRDLLLLAAIIDGKAVGTVQLVSSQKPNQRHRADLVKMLVHSDYRKQGIGQKLLDWVDFEAKQRGITLITLDTASGSDAERLYLRAGYQKVGTIPDYALWPDGGYCDTTYFYKRIE
jgi:GNAT superfamily N-acetyltransferase